MAAAEHRNQQFVHNLVLPDDDLADFLPHSGIGSRKSTNRFALTLLGIHVVVVGVFNCFVHQQSVRSLFEGQIEKR